MPIINNNTAEPTETFEVRLSNPDRATIADNTGVGTILDNDGAQPSISINDVTVVEGGTANFAVTLSAASTQTVTVARQYRQRHRRGPWRLHRPQQRDVDLRGRHHDPDLRGDDDQ